MTIIPCVVVASVVVGVVVGVVGSDVSGMLLVVIWKLAYRP